jgi:hypothetical protein
VCERINSRGRPKIVSTCCIQSGPFASSSSNDRKKPDRCMPH